MGDVKSVVQETVIFHTGGLPSALHQVEIPTNSNFPCSQAQTSRAWGNDKFYYCWRGKFDYWADSIFRTQKVILSMVFSGLCFVLFFKIASSILTIFACMPHCREIRAQWEASADLQVARQHLPLPQLGLEEIQGRRHASTHPRCQSSLAGPEPLSKVSRERD